MKFKYGSWIVDIIGYSVIGYTMSTYGLDAWDIFKLTLSILVIQSLISFVKEIIEY